MYKVKIKFVQTFIIFYQIFKEKNSIFFVQLHVQNNHIKYSHLYQKHSIFKYMIFRLLKIAVTIAQ